MPVPASKTEKISKAFDETTLSGKLVMLRTDQAEEFIDNVIDQSKVLKVARVEKMDAPRKEFAKVLAEGDFLKPSKGDKTKDDVDAFEFGSDEIVLEAKEVTGNIFISDSELRNNIEGTSITQKLLNILIKKIGNELEIFGITAVKKDSVYRTIDMFDGFVKRIIDNGNVLDASSSAIFGADARKINKGKFTKAWKMIPTQFRTPDMKFFAGSDTVIDYNDQFDNSYSRNEFVNNVLGKELVEVPLMAIDAPVPNGTASTTTTTESLKAQKVLNVTASTGFLAGQDVVIGLGTKYEQVLKVASVATGTITFTTNILQTIPNSAAVAVQTADLDGTDVILTTPENLVYGIQTDNMSFETSRRPNKGYEYYFKMCIDFQVEEPRAAVVIRHLKNV